MLNYLNKFKFVFVFILTLFLALTLFFSNKVVNYRDDNVKNKNLEHIETRGNYLDIVKNGNKISDILIRKKSYREQIETLINGRLYRKYGNLKNGFDLKLKIKDASIVRLSKNELLLLNYSYVLNSERTNAFTIIEFLNDQFHNVVIDLNGEYVEEIKSFEHSYDDKLRLKYYSQFNRSNPEVVEYTYKLEIKNRNLVLTSEVKDDKPEHNLDDVGGLIDASSINQFNFEYNNKRKNLRPIVNSIPADYIYDASFRKYRNGNKLGNINPVYYETSLETITEVFNNYNSKIYYPQEVLDFVKNVYENSDLFQLVEIDEPLSNFDKNKIKSLLFVERDTKDIERNKVLYFKNEKKFIFNTYLGLGVSNLKAVEKDKWEVDGDRVKVKFYKSNGKDLSEAYVILKLNDKLYNNNIGKSRYYIEKFSQ